jgi:uncharacterized membrane protein YedE/YeeE
MSSQARLRDEVYSFFTGKKASLVLACGLVALASLSRPALAHAQAESFGSAPTPNLLYGAGSFAAVYGILDHLGKQHFYCDGIGNPCSATPMTSQDQMLIYGGLLAVGVGLAIAIPGIVMAARQTDIETEAVTRYEHANGIYETPYPPEGARTPSSGPGAPVISISLLAFSF